jgi:NTP pyrophosphatase (non-canonical NTP hydrolase)
MSKITIEELRQQVRDFAVARDWEQFHSPKNLSMALIVEAAELVEHFQWLNAEQSQSLPEAKLAEVELELADIFIYLIRLADKLNIDLLSAANKKLKINAEKYPANTVRGSAKKYTDY